MDVAISTQCTVTESGGGANLESCCSYLQCSTDIWIVPDPCLFFPSTDKPSAGSYCTLNLNNNNVTIKDVKGG